MSFLESINRGKQKRPRRTVLYGTHGIGKTTWAAKWPGAVVLPTEDGCGDLDVASFPLAKTLGEAWGPIMEIGTPEADHDFKTIVLDSADWLGKGYGSAARIFQNILSAFNACRDAGLHVVIIAHCEVKKFNEPGIESYDRYTPKLHKEVAALLQEWADEVLFCNYKTYVKREDMGFNKSRGIAVGNSERVIYTQEGPGHLAKNRLGLPVEMSMDFEEYAPFLS